MKRASHIPPRAAELIHTLHLAPHPEGGYYREVFRSASTVQPHDDRDARSALTTIYFLLVAGAVSRWHRVRSDEVWHLYEGGPLELLDLDLSTRLLDTRQLGAVAANGTRPVHTVPAGHWQAARSLGPYALVGCTVGPGFDFADFHLMSDDATAAEVLRTSWPELAAFV
jgi:predicted cupin superfamily sugar epimerase